MDFRNADAKGEISEHPTPSLVRRTKILRAEENARDKSVRFHQRGSKSKKILRTKRKK